MKAPIANLAVRDVSATVAFYDKYLGFKLVDEVMVPSSAAGAMRVWASVENGEAKLFFQQQESLYEEYPRLRGDGELGGTSTLQIIVEDVDLLFAQLQAVDIEKAVEVVKAPTATTYGLREAAIVDLNGYVLVFGSRPGGGRGGDENSP